MPTLCRKCHVHPEILSAYVGGELLVKIRDEIDHEIADKLGKLRPEEAAVLAFLRTRISREMERKAA